jgi:adenylosuccinate synthase
MINGATQVVMTKADVLDSFDELNICTSYKIKGKETAEVPYQMLKMQIEPQYQTFKGWKMDSSKLKEGKEVPKVMTEYISFINSFIKAPVTYVSNGPGRDQIIKI